MHPEKSPLLDLYDDQVLHGQIDTISKIELHSVVNDGKSKLTFTKITGTLQFIMKTSAVGNLQQSPTQSEP